MAKQNTPKETPAVIALVVTPATEISNKVDNTFEELSKVSIDGLVEETYNHKITQEDLTNNPDLVGTVEIGETVKIPVAEPGITPEEQAKLDQETEAKVIQDAKDAQELKDQEARDAQAKLDQEEQDKKDQEVKDAQAKLEKEIQDKKERDALLEKEEQNKKDLESKEYDGDPLLGEIKEIIEKHHNFSHLACGKFLKEELSKENLKDFYVEFIAEGDGTPELNRLVELLYDYLDIE